MQFKDFNNIDNVTLRADFLVTIKNAPENIKEKIKMLKESGFIFEEIFNIILKFIESNKQNVSYELIETLLVSLYEVFQQDKEIAASYIALLECFASEDVNKCNIKELFTEEFASNALVSFNILFASYYLNLLIERSNDIDEINRVNEILKQSIINYKLKYGRN